MVVLTVRSPGRSRRVPGRIRPTAIVTCQPARRRVAAWLRRCRRILPDPGRRGPRWRCRAARRCRRRLRRPSSVSTSPGSSAPSTASTSVPDRSSGPARSGRADGRRAARASSSGSGLMPEPATAELHTVLREEIERFAAGEEVGADAGGEAHRELQAGVGAATAMRHVAAVEQHGHPAAPRPFLQPHHQFVVARRAAPVHAAQLVALPVGPDEDVRRALALVGQCRARRALARPDGGRQPLQRDHPGQHDQAVGRCELPFELREPQRIGGRAAERADAMHAPQHRAKGVGDQCAAPAGQPVHREPRGSGGLRACGVGCGVGQPERAEQRAAVQVEPDGDGGADRHPGRGELALDVDPPPGPGGEQQGQQQVAARRMRRSAAGRARRGRRRRPRWRGHPRAGSGPVW